MQDKIKAILDEVQKVIVGKRTIIETALIAVLANGHILLDDVPGVGKTTLAVTLGNALGLKYKRIQFTPDVMPSDITGFSMYNKQTGEFEYRPGAVTEANILLCDEINRASGRTQSALLEAMEERQATVDGVSYPLKTPFAVIATQNNIGAGIQPLPYAQLDRFLVKLSIGYPDFESQMEIIRDRQKSNPADGVKQVTTRDEILAMQSEVLEVTVKDSVISYITQLAVSSRENSAVEIGISPRGALSVCRTAKARAYVHGRDYVTPEDVRAVFFDTCTHRIIVNRKSKINQANAKKILEEVLDGVKTPHSRK